jgi:hypothetical protein
MATTTFLGLRKLTAGQASAEVTANAQFDAFDAQLDLTQVLDVRDDFTGGVGSTGSPFVAVASGTSSAVGTAVYTGEQNAIGVLTLDTGTDTNGYANVRGATAALLRLGGGTVRLRCRFRVEDLSDGTNTYTVRAGLGDSTVAGQPTDGVFVRYTHGTNSGKFECVTRSNGTETATDSGITVAADTWYTVDIAIDETAAEVVFTINGTEVATNTTNIPTAVGRETGVQVSILKSAGTTARVLNVDFLGLRVEFTTART